MEQLREKLLKYKELTDCMIDSIENEEEEKFKKIVAEKQLLINSIDTEETNSVFLKEIFKELGLVEQDMKLHRIIEEKKIYIKNEIKHIDENRNASKAYNNTFLGYNLLNKKI
jgi:ClpP class serine protease